MRPVEPSVLMAPARTPAAQGVTSAKPGEKDQSEQMPSSGYFHLERSSRIVNVLCRHHYAGNVSVRESNR